MRVITFASLVLLSIAFTASSRASSDDISDTTPAAPLSTQADSTDVALASSSGAQERTVNIGAQLWYTFGAGEWEIEFGNFFFKGRSLLEWEDIDAPVLVLNAEVPITRKFSIGGLVGYGEYTDGMNTDTDWIGDFKFSESQSDSDGDVTLADLNVFYNLIEPSAGNNRLTLDVFVGGQYYKDDITMTDGVQTIIDEQPVMEPFGGLNSTYSFEWFMARAGARAQVSLTDAISAGGSLAYLALIKYEGEAYWNLRDDYRSESPNFEHESTDGYGVEAKVFVHIQLTEILSANLGYWFLSLEADDGTDTIYFADGTTSETDLTHVESTRHGAYAGLTFEL